MAANGEREYKKKPGVCVALGFLCDGVGYSAYPISFTNASKASRAAL